MVGVRLSAVRSKGLAHSMGLRNGDTVLAANGVKLKSLEAGRELFCLCLVLIGRGGVERFAPVLSVGQSQFE